MAYTIINNKNWILGLLAGMAVALTCCTKEQTSCGEPAPEQEGYKTLTISARSTYAADAGLEEIHSAYVFIYNASDSILENTSNIVFSNGELDKMSFRVKYGNDRVKKNIYVIANPDAELKLKLNASLKEYEMATLLTSANPAVFSEDSIAKNGLLMSGKLTIDDVTKVSTAQVSLTRRYARIDLMLRKNENLQGPAPKIKKVEFMNQKRQSYVYSSDLSGNLSDTIDLKSFSVPISVNATGYANPNMPDEGYDTIASFYTYERLSKADSNDSAAALRITADMQIGTDLQDQEYIIYICSTAENGGTGNDKNRPVSIQQNKVYVIKGSIYPRTIRFSITPWDFVDDLSGNINYFGKFTLTPSRVEITNTDIINIKYSANNPVSFDGYYMNGKRVDNTSVLHPEWLPEINIQGLPNSPTKDGTIFITGIKTAEETHPDLVLRLSANGVKRDITVKYNIP